MKRARNQRKQYIENSVEAKRDTNDVLDSAVSTAKDFAGDFWKQVLGIKKEQRFQSQGDLQEGQELLLTNVQKEAEEKNKIKDTEPGIDYRGEILHGEKRIASERNQEIATKIQEILIELKRLMHSSQELQTEVKEIAVEPRIANPGKYHVSFFEWMLLIIKSARMKVEDSAAWLAIFKSKKAKREYWAMFKKHGTTFGLSNERVVSTQTG